jgi:hypothetical protein
MRAAEAQQYEVRSLEHPSFPMTLQRVSYQDDMVIVGGVVPHAGQLLIHRHLGVQHVDRAGQVTYGIRRFAYYKYVRASIDR